MIAQDIRVRIGRKIVLDGIGVEARAGEITAIVGPNGSGKSTLIKALTGELAAEGRISLNGRAVGDIPGWELAAIRGVLQQAVTVAFPFTVREIVQLGHAAGFSAGNQEVPEKALAMMDLDGFAERFYHQLSGGEQQRVQIARVLAQVWPEKDDDTKWLFLDEPVSSLDIGHQFTVMDRMRALAAQGAGVIAVMHDLNLTAMYADHVILLKSGNILASGPVREVLRDEMLSEAYDCPVRVNAPVPEGMPYILPQTRLYNMHERN
ncbi:heme ABC transporter ATP-binding protein [Cribrihabitans sp. XS_ASV171]